MQDVDLKQPKSSVENEVLRIRGMLGRNQFSAALDAAERLLAQVPENRDVLYMIAVSQRYLRRIPDALRTLAHFETLHPDYSRLHQERGHCHVAAANPAAAITAYLRAVNINVALPASWNALSVLFRAAGAAADADTAASHVAKLKTLPPAVVTATSMFADGEIHEAERTARQFLLANPDHVEAMRLLAQIGMKLDVLDDAEFLLESILVFAPDYAAARYDYVRVLLQRHQHAKALHEAETLLQSDSTNRAFRTIHATVSVALGDYDGALRTYRDLLPEASNAAEIHLSIAHALKTLGRRSDAIDAYHAAAAANPSYGDAYWSLANLKTYRFDDVEIERMRAAETAPATGLVDRYHLAFALGKALEDRGDYAQSFGCYARGNAFKKQESRYSADVFERNLRLQKTVCTREFFAARRRVGCHRADPIFIVGLPRAGSTLLEQILASHSRVEGTMELADIPRLVHTLQGRDHHEANPRYPDILAQLRPEQYEQFGEKYLADTAVYRTGRDHFIDKMPNNFRHIGLIHLMLPNARIIDARREPMACCFSNFKQLFATGQEFTYSLDDIARYYRSYVDMMNHWDTALPGKVLKVQHEDVVADLESNVRRILDFCGLDFEPQCLEFHKTERSIRTASSEQVRRPIYTEGLDQWKHFEPWLKDLQQALRGDKEDDIKNLRDES